MKKLTHSLFHRRLLVLAVFLTATSQALVGQSVLVSNFHSDEVLRFTLDGTFTETLISAGSGGLIEPHRTRIAPDGGLLVASASTDRILRDHASTGAFLGESRHLNSLAAYRATRG